MKNHLFLFVFLLLGLSCFILACTSNKDAGLPGSWKLIADQQVDSSGKVISQDTAVSGLLIYTAEGKMSVQARWNKSRNTIMTDTIMNGDGVSYGAGLGLNSWTFAQTRTIIDTYDAYFGDYTVDKENNIVTHIVTANLRPEKNGVVYKRKFLLSNDTLFLRSTDPAMKWQMAWVRVVKQ